jgi:hypothetical protein
MNFIALPLFNPVLEILQLSSSQIRFPSFQDFPILAHHYFEESIFFTNIQDFLSKGFGY